MQIGSVEYIEFYKKQVCDLLSRVKREGIDNLLAYLDESGFYNCPASQYFHANHPGGLAYHSYNLCKIALAYVKLHKLNISEESVIISAICHDLCKIGNYKLETKWQKDRNNKWESYLTYGNNNISSVQHGPQSALIAARFIRLTPEEEQAICWHMGAYGQSDADNRAMGNAMKDNPLVLIIQQADMASAYFYEECYDRDKIPGLNF